MKYLRKLDDLLALFEKSLAVLLFSGLILLTLFNIIARNIFGVSFSAILEISPAFVLWLALVGSSLCVKDKRHIKLEIFLRLASPKWRRIANILSSVFGMAVMGILFLVSCRFVKNEMIIFGSRGLLSVIFPWFFAMACFRFFIRLTDLPDDIKGSINDDS